MESTVKTPTLPRGPSTCSRRRRSGATRRHGQEDADPEDKEKQSPCPNTKGDIVDLASFDEEELWPSCARRIGILEIGVEIYCKYMSEIVPSFHDLQYLEQLDGCRCIARK